MKQITGNPHALKEVNFCLVRRAIQANGTATRAEIMQQTKLSVTTIRTILTEMLQSGELLIEGHDNSAGGRRAVRYALETDRFFGVALLLGSETVRYLIVNVCGEILEQGSFAVDAEPERAVCAFLDERTAAQTISAIGIGVPGIVSGTGYQTKLPGGNLENHPIGELVRRRYGVAVVLENDLNAITLGFGRCFLRQYPQEACEQVHMAYVHFSADCLSAGFLSGGRVLRGWNQFVGELGLFPVDENRTLDDLLGAALSDQEYAQMVAKVLAGICCILNPQYIALGGEHFRRDCLALITECFDNTLPRAMAAEILFAEDASLDYCEGMAHLTAQQLFADVRLVTQ